MEKEIIIQSRRFYIKVTLAETLTPGLELEVKAPENTMQVTSVPPLVLAVAPDVWVIPIEDSDTSNDSNSEKNNSESGANEEPAEDGIIGKSEDFLKSQTDVLDYLVYDIDKDGSPELSIGKNIENCSNVFEIYSYKDDEFIYEAVGV